MPGNFEDVGLRATIQNVGGFEAAERRVNAGFTRLGSAAAKTATQSSVAAGSIGGSMDRVANAATRAGNASARGFNQTSKGMMQMADSASHAEGLFFRMLAPLTTFGFAVFSIQFLVAAFGALGNAVLGASVKWEQLQTSFRVFLGSAELAKDKLEELSAFARTSPLTLPELAEGTVRLLAYGFAAEELISILGDIGDAAAGLGKEAFPAITRALGQMRQRTKVAAQDMLQLTEAGIPAWQLLADAMKVPVRVVMDLAEKGLIPADQAITVLLAGIRTKFAGLREEQAKTFAGMLSNLQDWAFRARVIFMAPLFEQLKGQLANLLKAVDNKDFEAALERWGKAAGKGLSLAIDAFRLVGNVVGGVIGPIIDLIKRATPTFEQIGVVMGNAATEAKPLFNFLGLIGRTFLDFATDAAPSVLSILGQVAATLTSMAPGVQLFGRIWGSVSVDATKAGGALVNLYLGLRGISDALKQAADPAGAVMRTFRDLAAAVTAAFNTILDAALPVMTDIWETLVAGWQSIEPLIAPAIAAIQERVEGMLKDIQKFWQEHGANILAIVRGIWQTVGAIIETAFNIVITVVRGLLKVFAGDWEGAWQEALNLVGVIWQGILDIVGNVGQTLFQVVKLIVRNLRLEDDWFNLRDFVLKVWSDIVNGIKARLNEGIRNINGFLDAAKGVSDTMRMFMVNIPVPEFRIKPFDIEKFIPPPRPGWFGDEANADMDLFNKNLEKAKTGSSFLQDILNRFKPQVGPRQWEGFGGVDTTAKLADQSDRAREKVEQLADELGQVGEAAAKGGDEGRAALRALERQVDDTKDAVKGLERGINELEDALKDAQDAMRAFADPRLLGMQAAEDEIFELELAVKKARLEELKMGDAAKDAVKDVGASFDLLGAQQRELAEGIPVPFQRAAFEAEQAKRRAEELARAAAKPKKKDEDEETEVDRLQRLLDVRRLEKEISFEPLLRQLRERFETLTGANKEITFDEAAAGLEASAQEAEALSVQILEQKDILAGQQAILEAQQIVLEAAKRAYEDQNDAAKAVGETVEANTGLENLRLAALAAQTSELRTQTAEMEKQATIQSERAGALAGAARVGVNPNEVSVGTGFGGGGSVSRGGMARVGERGPETVLLPAGAQVVPSSPMPATSVSRSESNTFNIEGVTSPVDVADAVRRMWAFDRIRRGRG